MNLDAVLKAKNFFRFTGPPEHWLTAVKYMTWGLQKHHLKRWRDIQPGDIFFIHSTRESLFPNAQSGIIGLGVIGPNLTQKQGPLWLKELIDNSNTWPLLIPLSEIYLFSELPPIDTWEAPNTKNQSLTKNLIDTLIANRIPIREVPGFPAMGSFSSVSSKVSDRILSDKRPLYIYTAGEVADTPLEVITLKEKDNDQLLEVKNADEALRYADTLQIFDVVKGRTIREPTSEYIRDNETLERANSAHTTVLQQLIHLFRSRGYETRFGRKTIDLFAYNERKSFLCEVKSTENRNFRSQARKGIAQLFEYEYFDVQKFTDENKLTFTEKHKLIIPSQVPGDERYVNFINSLTIGVAMVGQEKLQPIGKDTGFSKI
ncbi:MAG: hypothetical protein Q7S50_03120 [bacterium]|nr:hypothetical protein [bacterium]